jgi:hypothetical protein
MILLSDHGAGSRAEVTEEIAVVFSEISEATTIVFSEATLPDGLAPPEAKLTS